MEFPATNAARASGLSHLSIHDIDTLSPNLSGVILTFFRIILTGNKRSFDDLDDDEDDIFGSKKGRTKAEEDAPGVTTSMILSLRESLKNCKDELASCQNELESAKTEIIKWKSAFQNESFVPAGKSPEPRFLIDYIQNLKSSERSLKEQLEIAKRKEASCIVQYAKREQEMAELKSAVRDLKSQLKPASMQKMLNYNPAERIAAKTAPDHLYFDNLDKSQ
ncbi:hypothetical protein F2Q69_00061810 [Brassica cretica]|uniref:FKBP12-interacting protein of 37 kDa n=1 Tax=Brassica cretica TaxID=69181 RepID=A0A8S9RET5_BRACR|nr:hypothetical protein F2Q69_00061810 [Brassica cretica]